MELEERLYALLYDKLAYPGTIAKSDLKLICQGRARPVVQFCVSVLKSPEDKRRIELNLRASQSAPEAPHPPRPSQSPRLRRISELERKLAGLKRDFLVKSLQHDVQTAFSQRVQSDIRDFSLISTQLSTQSSPLLAPQPLASPDAQLQSSMQQLEALCEDSKSLPSADAAFLVLQAGNLTTSLPHAFQQLTASLTRDKSQLSERSTGSLADEALKHGFLYRKDGLKGSLQRTDALTLLTKLRTRVDALRSREWTHFLAIESLIQKAKLLRETFHKVQSAKTAIHAQYTAQLREFLSLELEVNGYRAQVNALEKGLRDLEGVRESVASNLALLQANPAKTQKISSEKEAVVSKFAALMDANSAYRRNLPKLKLRIKDFVSKHFVTKIQAVQAVEQALKGIVQTELAAVKNYWTAVSSGGQGRRDKAEDWKVQRVLDALEVPFYTSNEEMYAQLRPAREVPMPAELPSDLLALAIKMHRQWLQSDPASQPATRLQSLEAFLASERSALSSLQSTFLPLYQSQPAQYLVPWVRDAEGLNVQEWMDQWRSHILSVGD